MIVKLFLRSPYNYDPSLVSEQTGLSCPEPTLAQQQFKDDGDPNVIMRLFAQTGDVGLLQVRNPEYGDFTGISDYHTALNAVVAAQDSFNSLPASVRSRFENDPGRLIDFLSDPSNSDEAVALGLVSKPSQSGSSEVSVSEGGSSDV